MLDNDFAFSLRERKSATLAAMFTDALEVEANMMASGKMKHRDIDRRKKEEKLPSTSSSTNDVKFEMMMKTMEKLMDRLTMDTRPFNREQGDPQIRNPNFRRPNPPVPPQNRQRDQRNPRNQEEQPIRPPFPENYVADEEYPLKMRFICLESRIQRYILLKRSITCLNRRVEMKKLKRRMSLIKEDIYTLWMMYRGKSD